MSLLLITITIALSSANYFSRFSILENEFKEHSSNLAEACLDYAYGKIVSNPSYAGNESAVRVGSDNCAIVSVSALGADKIIKTQGIYPQNQPKKSYTDLKVEVDNNFVIQSWQECTDFNSC